MGNRRLPGLLVLAVALAAIALVWRARPAGVPATEEGAARERGQDPSPRGLAPAEPASRAAAEDGAATPVLAATEADLAEREGFPVLDLSIVDADGRALPEGRAPYAYAMPAGARGRSRVEKGPHAALDSAGRCRLVLPAPGAYDVGLHTRDTAGILARDVVVPAREPLALRLPETAVVEVAAEEGVRGALAGRAVHLLEASASEALEVPGRNEARARSFDLWDRGAASSTVSVRLPAGLPFRVSLSDRRFRPRPEEIRAPGRLVIGAAGPIADANLRLRIRGHCVPAERTFPTDVQLLVGFRVEGGEPVLAMATLERERPLSEVHLDADLLVPSPSGTVSWAGKGVTSGSATFAGLTPRGRRSNLLGVAIEVVDPPPWAPLSVRETARPAAASARLRAGPGLLSGEVGIDVLTEGGTIPGCSIAPGAEASVDLGDDAEWVLFVSEGGLVAGPARVADEGVTEVALSAGGWLVVVPERMPPVGLGEVVLEREDGAPFPWRGALVGSGGTNLAVEPGQVIGPFESGPVSFRVRVGEADFGVVRAHVEAGAYDALRIPALRPRR